MCRRGDTVVHSDVALDAGGRSANDAADRTALGALVRYADWPARHRAGGVGAPSARAGVVRPPEEWSGGGHGIEQPQPSARQGMAVNGSVS